MLYFFCLKLELNLSYQNDELLQYHIRQGSKIKMLCCNKTWKNKKIIKLIQNLRTKLLNIFEKIYVIFAENFILIKCNKNIIENFQRILFKICEKILIKKYEKINFIHFLLIYIIIILFWWWPDLGTWLSWPLLLWAGIFMYWRKKKGRLRFSYSGFPDVLSSWDNSFFNFYPSLRRSKFLCT